MTDAQPGARPTRPPITADAIGPAAVERLMKFAGMIGSEHDGEALNAARAATRVLADHGISWREALASLVPAPRPYPAMPPIPVRPTTTFVRMVLACRDHPALFNGKERDFIRDMDGHALAGRQPTTGQSAWLDRLHARALDHLAAVAA